MNSSIRQGALYSAVILMATVVVLPLTSCSKTTSEIRSGVISSDTPWYDAEYITYADEIVGESDGIIPVTITPDYRVFFQSYDENYNELRRVIAVNTESDDTYVIDCPDYIDEVNCRIDFSTCFVDGDDVYIALIINNQSGCENRIYRYDKSTDSFTDEITVNFDEQYENPIIVKAYKRRDLLYIEYNYLEGVYYRYGIKVIGVNGEQYFETVFNDILTDWIVEEDGEIIARIRETDGNDISDSFLSINPTDGVFTQLDISTEDIVEHCNGILMDDGCIYSNNLNMSINKFDLRSGETSRAIDLNYCDANLCDLMYSTILYCDEDHLIMVETVTGINRPSKFNSLIEIDHVDDNPHAGKTVLYAAPYDSIGYVEAEAVREFNYSSDDFYICITMDYSVLSVQLPYAYNEEEIITRYRLDDVVIRRLKDDICTGRGPDILLNYGQFFELNKNAYLHEINNFMDSDQGIDRYDYYDNIFRAFETDGNLYQVPLSVFVTGIYTPADNRPEDCVGFTYEEYEDFVSEYCNGNDPIDISFTRKNAFDLLFSYNNKLFFDADGHLNLSGEAFRDLLEYTNILSTEADNNSQYMTTRLVSFMGIVNDLYYMNISTSPYVLCGFPSDEDSRGAMARIIDSVAVTSCCEHSDVAWGFVKTCLSYDIQRRTMGTNPINRQAFLDYADSLIPSANQYIESMSGISNYYTSDSIVEYSEYLSSATECQRIDAQIMIILYEEIQSYFSGDKSEDEVIAIIEGRVNNMIDEQGD